MADLSRRSNKRSWLWALGLDRKEHVLTAQQLDGIRDFAKRRLVVVDFNLFGSTSGLDEMPGVKLFQADRLELLVDAYADELCSTDEFKEAFEEAEVWIERRVRCEISAASIPETRSVHECEPFDVSNAGERMRPFAREPWSTAATAISFTPESEP